jgi:DNA-binding transcriptional regulator YdaS (Cro superfamily)
MTPQRAVKHFGTQVALAASLGVSQPAVSNWVKRGRVPAIQQLALQSITAGALKADRDVVKQVSRT